MFLAVPSAPTVISTEAMPSGEISNCRSSENIVWEHALSLGSAFQAPRVSKGNHALPTRIFLSLTGVLPKMDRQVVRHPNRSQSFL